MLWKIIFVTCCAVLLVKADMKSDVDVFNKNYNRNQRNARDYLLRSFDVVPSNFVRILLLPSSHKIKEKIQEKEHLLLLILHIPILEIS